MARELENTEIVQQELDQQSICILCRGWKITAYVLLIEVGIVSDT